MSQLALAFCVAVAAAALCTPRAVSSVEAGSGHTVLLFPSASDPRGRRGLARVINHSARAGEVTIRAFDDDGAARGPLTLSIGANKAVHLSSRDLENGNAAKGLSGGTGPGKGHWRLELSSGLDIEVLSYVRTADGFLIAMHDTAPAEGGRHRVAIFNPGSDRYQVSLLRLVNPGGEAARVSITGVDDAGASPGPGAMAIVPARGSRTYTAAELESGHAVGLWGSIGDGAGKWRLVVESEQPVVAMSLLSSPTGHLANLSTAPGRGAGPSEPPPGGGPGPPETVEEVFEALVSPVVQSKCVNCHVRRGVSGHTRLVFATGAGAGHLAANLKAFEDFVAGVANGSLLILTKIQGGAGHGGGVQVARGSAELAGFERFLALLRPGNVVIPGGATIAGTAYADAGGRSPLAGAECEFAAVAEDGLGPGVRLASGTANRAGAFSMAAPADTDGYLVCRPAGLRNAGLLAFARTGTVGAPARDRRVSPRTTVEAMALAMEVVRDPGLDRRARAAALAGSLAGDPHAGLLADAGEGLFAVLRARGADVRFFELLLDAFGNGRIDARGLESGLAAALDGAVARVERAAGGRRVFVAATRTFADLPALAAEKGVDDPAPSPPLAPDPGSLASRAEGFRSMEFARNPSLYYMNAHWAYARGLDGSGETTGMVDSGLYAAHEEFAGRLHDETVYTVVHDASPNAVFNHYYTEYPKVGEKDPATAYPHVSPDPNIWCQGVTCRFYQYNHGTLMASLAVGARNRAGAHGTAFGAELFFRPFRQYAFNMTIGPLWYHPPGDVVSRHLVSYHQIVRQVGDLAPIVSNSWLTGDSTFWVDPVWADYSPFHEVLPPRYARYQRDRHATDQALLLWSAGNRPLSAGPLVDGAAVPSVSERQLRALSGGRRGLADLLLTDEERAGIPAAEALRRAERALEALKRRWLAVVAVADAEDTRARWQEHVDCALSASAGSGHCAVDWTIAASSRCGYASDWCVAVGPTWGGVKTSFVDQPQPTGLYSLEPFRTSEAAAAASGALAVLLQAYRGADGRLTVGTNTVLKRLGATARRDLFDPAARRGPDARNELLREEEMIRALIRHAGASDDDLRRLIDTARAELSRTPPAGAAPTDRVLILNRLVDYETTIDTGAIRDMLNAVRGDAARTNDLLAQLIRQIEWIDEQLRRRGRNKATATDDDVRQIAITSLIGHGLIDLEAATDPR